MARQAAAAAAAPTAAGATAAGADAAGAVGVAGPVDGAAADGQAAGSAAPDGIESAEAAYMHGLLELASLLARGGAIADLATLSADGVAHGEPLSAVESLALHVKALDLMAHGISLAEHVANHAASTPPT